VYRQPVIALDVFATAVALSDAPVKRDRVYDGVNLIPYLTGETAARPHQQLFWRTGRRAALRHGDWKLLRNPKRRSDPKWELYNLADDIGEENNLAETQQAKLHELRLVWEKVNGEMIDPVWNPRR
jgi:arylsulfatase B